VTIRQEPGYTMRSHDPTALAGCHVELWDEGEGWFGGAEVLPGRIESVLLPIGGEPARYVVRFDATLSVQERGAATVSGFILRHYSHCAIQCRWQDVEIGPERPVSVYVRLVQLGAPVPSSWAEVDGLQLRVWARCVVWAQLALLSVVAIVTTP